MACPATSDNLLSSLFEPREAHPLPPDPSFATEARSPPQVSGDQTGNPRGRQPIGNSPFAVIRSGVTEATSVFRVRGRLTLEMRAGQIVEQHVGRDPEQILPALAQKREPLGLVFHQLVPTATKVVLGYPVHSWSASHGAGCG